MTPSLDEKRALLIQELREDQRKALSGVDEREQTRASAQWVIRVLSEQIKEWNRETAILFEEFFVRLDAITEGVAALSTKVDGLEPGLSIQIDRTDAKLDMVLARLDRPARDQH